MLSIFIVFSRFIITVTIPLRHQQLIGQSLYGRKTSGEEKEGEKKRVIISMATKYYLIVELIVYHE